MDWRLIMSFNDGMKEILPALRRKLRDSALQNSELEIELFQIPYSIYNQEVQLNHPPRLQLIYDNKHYISLPSLLFSWASAPALRPTPVLHHLQQHGLGLLKTSPFEYPACLRQVRVHSSSSLIAELNLNHLQRNSGPLLPRPRRCPPSQSRNRQHPSQRSRTAHPVPRRRRARPSRCLDDPRTQGSRSPHLFHARFDHRKHQHPFDHYPRPNCFCGRSGSQSQGGRG